MNDNSGTWRDYINTSLQKEWSDSYVGLTWYMCVIFTLLGGMMVYLSYFTELFVFNSDALIIINDMVEYMSFLIRYVATPIAGLAGLLSLICLPFVLRDKPERI